MSNLKIVTENYNRATTVAHNVKTIKEYVDFVSVWKFSHAIALEAHKRAKNESKEKGFEYQYYYQLSKSWMTQFYDLRRDMKESLKEGAFENDGVLEDA